MTSQKQVEANRINAQHSTGPCTPAGKAAIRLNALKHGLRASCIVLPGEDPEEFHGFCTVLEIEWQPETFTEQLHLEEMALAQWKLARADRIEAQLLATPEAMGREGMGYLMQISQYQARLKSSFIRAQHELERLQQKRATAAAEPEPVQRAVTTPSAPPPEPTHNLYVMSASVAAPSLVQMT
jgi:hypothetical protein